jgi:hypothetical protein
MWAYVLRQGKSISVIVGFAFGFIGAIWSFLVVDRQSEQLKQLTDAKAALTRELQTLNSIASEYFIVNQQGDLIFMLALQPNARRDLASLIYQGNILDRATPVRNMIGALAVARQLDYRQTYNDYEKFSDATRANLTLGNFTALKQKEKNIIVKGQQRVPVLMNRLFEIDKAINANEAAQKKNRVVGMLSSLFGSLILLIANLLARSGGSSV